MSENRIKVAVSHFYGGKGWTDKKTGIKFEPNTDFHVNEYSIPEGKDLSGIRNALRLNSLILVEGKLEDLDEIEVKEQPKKQEKKEAPKKETPKAEAKEDEKKEEKKQASTQKKASTSNKSQKSNSQKSKSTSQKKDEDKKEEK